MNADFEKLCSWAADVREQHRDAAEERVRTVNAWREDVERADADTGLIRFGAVEACKLIERLTAIDDSEIVAICAALFRIIQPNAHIESRRDALAALVDVIHDHARCEEEPIDPDDDCDRKHDERRDNNLTEQA